MLENIAIFKALSAENIQLIESHGKRKLYKKNTMLFSEGEYRSSLYIVISGEIRVYLTNEQGKEYTINGLTSGAHFGEISLIDGEARSANVSIVEESLLFELSNEKFQLCLDKHPSIAINLLKNLAERIRKLTDEIRSFALYDTSVRIEKLLWELAVQENHETVINNFPSQEKIATRIGASREMVGRVLRDLEKKSYIQRDKKHVIILDKLAQKMNDNFE